MKIKKNILLASYTTFAIGGPADYFCQPKTKKEVIKALQWAKNNNLNYFILGAGSNVLISDKGVRGLVVQMQNLGFKIQNSKIIAEAGLSLAKLLQIALNHSLSGLEFLAGIPGIVGGAIVANAGTKKSSISQLVEKVTVLAEDGQIEDISLKECRFGYRKSRFLKTKEIVLEVVFKLKKEKPEVIKQKMAAILKTRKGQPKGKNVGSVFKNPSLAPAGELIEKAGLKGKRIGRAMISKKHANWIINLDKASSTDVLKLISLIKKKVKEYSKIDLEEEIRLLGEFDG